MKYLLQLVRNYPYTCICVAMVWILSLTPFFPETPLDDVAFIDKWTHFIMYGGTFGVLWIEYLRRHTRLDARKLFLLAWLCPVLMGGLLELLQAYCTTTRNGDWLDFLANSIGVTLASLLGLAASRFFTKS